MDRKIDLLNYSPYRKDRDMSYRSQPRMVNDTDLAHRPKRPVVQPGDEMLDLRGYQVIDEREPAGLRSHELRALRFICWDGPMSVRDYYRKCKVGTRRAKQAILHDLHRLGYVRIFDARDPEGKECKMLVAVKPIDFDTLERTLCTLPGSGSFFEP